MSIFWSLFFVLIFKVSAEETEIPDSLNATTPKTSDLSTNGNRRFYGNIQFDDK